MSGKSTLSNLGVHEVLHHRRQHVPFLRKRSTNFMNQHQPLLHHDYVLPLSRTLMPRRKGGAQELRRIAQSEELLHHC